MGRKATIFLATCVLIATLSWLFVHRSVSLEKKPIILGHGGMGVRHWLPIDSEKSIRKALSYPIDGTELDVQMTQDGQLVACHNDSLHSFRGKHGLVADHLFSELVDFELNGWFSSEPFVKLSELIDSEWPDSTVFSLDLKPYGLKAPFLIGVFKAAIAKLVSEHPNYRFLIESQDAEFLRDLKEQGVNAKFFYYTSSTEEAITTIQQMKLDGVSINLSLITEADVRSFQDSSILIMTWGMGTVFSNRKALEMQPDYIQTDAIPSMVRILD